MNLCSNDSTKNNATPPTIIFLVLHDPDVIMISILNCQSTVQGLYVHDHEQDETIVCSVEVLCFSNLNLFCSSSDDSRTCVLGNCVLGIPNTCIEVGNNR